LSRSTAIVRRFPKKRKVHNDVPQLQNRSSKGRYPGQNSLGKSSPRLRANSVFIPRCQPGLVGHSHRQQTYIRPRINKSSPNSPAAPFSRALLLGMSTERQQNASRANGSKSRGPVTPAGKLASSRNAITHGMLSTTVVLNGESTDRFLELFDALLDEFQPQTPFEESLIENMAVARWRQMRIWGMEKAGMEHEMHRLGVMPNPAGLDPSGQAATRAAIAFRTLSDDSRSLELINRYDSRYDRQYYRAHRRFVETRDRRTPPSAPLNPTPPPSPLPASQPEPPVPEKVVIAKGTPEVAANKPCAPHSEGGPISPARVPHVPARRLPTATAAVFCRGHGRRSHATRAQ